jgi:predicted amidohydrolase YtcJ
MEVEQTSKMLRYGAVKGYVDGSLGSHSALFFEPFQDNADYSGDQVNSFEELFDWILKCDNLNIQVFIHAIGDKAIHIILNVFEKVVSLNGAKDRRWRVEHS